MRIHPIALLGEPVALAVDRNDNVSVTTRGQIRALAFVVELTGESPAGDAPASQLRASFRAGRREPLARILP